MRDNKVVCGTTKLYVSYRMDRVNPPKLGPKPEDLDWGLSKEEGGAREVFWKEGQPPLESQAIGNPTPDRRGPAFFCVEESR